MTGDDGGGALYKVDPSLSAGGGGGAGGGDGVNDGNDVDVLFTTNVAFAVGDDIE